MYVTGLLRRFAPRNDGVWAPRNENFNNAKIFFVQDLSKYTDIHYDSRQLQSGSIFVAIKGENFDGNNFVEDAITKGATLIISEDALELEGVETLQVADARLELAKIASQIYGQPSQKISVLGVTGTNGKTTVTHLIQGLLDSSAVLGTMGLKLSPQAQYQDLGNTTPQSKETQKILADLVKDNYKYLAMEVSSHAVDQKRVAEIDFDTMVVTNLTQDHLDYHLTMENYFQAKAKSFEQVSSSVILNADDNYYGQFRSKAKEQKLKILSYGINAGDYQASEIQYSDSGIVYKLKFENELVNINLQLNGEFNVYNSLAAIVAVHQQGLSLAEIAEKLAKVEPVSGRFEVIKEAGSAFCIVDYAHSPDGLLNVLKGANQLKDGEDYKRVICLFGCGGDRDITKRPKMARIAYDNADFVYVSSDNPRTEDPEQIIADILTGIPDMSKVKVISNRQLAIQEAVANSNADDILVVAGKGHEDYQIIGTEKQHFDDREEVRKAINLLAQS